ncbi:hypothetical protein [Lactobacillus terrae]|uniref:hypothetical protein n=1 Tax=Lactobacillus terrae TaxID=2269374 RepID=UPI000C1B63D8|nr:hypothetical protein [Lactobacillus terrae]
MSLLKKAVVFLSALSLVLPFGSYTTANLVEAASQTNEVANSDTQPTTDTSVPFRDANGIFNSKVEKEDGGQAFVTTIAPSEGNVIQKGDKFTVKFDPTNVDIQNSKAISESADVPFTVTKDVENNSFVYTFTKDVTGDSYTTGINIATKNVAVKSTVVADFNGSDVTVSDNEIQSYEQAVPVSNQSQETTSSQSANQTSTSTSQSVTSYSEATTESSTSTQASSDYAPTYSEAAQAVLDNTTIEVSGQATTNTDVTTDSAATASSVATTDNSAATTDSSVTTEAATDSNAETTPVATTQESATATSDSAAATVANNATTATTQADANSEYIDTPNGKPTDVEATLTNAVKDQTTDDPKGEETSYQDSSVYEETRDAVYAKLDDSVTENERSEILKTMPWIWSNMSSAESQNSVFKYRTLLSTGRYAYVTVDATAKPDSESILEKNMPALVKVFGENIESDAFDSAVDMDVMLNSKLYQDYLNGTYIVPGQEVDPTSVWNIIKDHLQIVQVDSQEAAGEDSIVLNGVTYNSTATLNDYISQQMVQQAAEQAGVADSKDSTQTSNGATLFYNIERDVYNLMGKASSNDKAEILSSIPEILNNVSKNTASDDTVGSVHSFVQKTSDGNVYKITLDTTANPLSDNPYEVKLPQLVKSFGDKFRAGDFSQIIAFQQMQDSQVYADYLAGKYTPSGLVNASTTTSTGKTSKNMPGLIFITLLAIPLLAIGMGILYVLTAPIWILGTALVLAAALVLNIIPIILNAVITIFSPILLPILFLGTIAIAGLGGLISLIPIINIITLPLTIIGTILGIGATLFVLVDLLLWIPRIILAGLFIGIQAIKAVVALGIAVAIAVALVGVVLTLGLLPVLLPIFALLFLIVAALFAIGMILFLGIALPLLLLVLPAALLITGTSFAVFFLAAIPWLLGGSLATLIGLAIIVFLFIPALIVFQIVGLYLLMLGLFVFGLPILLVFGTLAFILGFANMALFFPNLVAIVLEIIAFLSSLLLLLFIPGLFVFMSWPIWVALVILVGGPIMIVLSILGLIPVVGWVFSIVAGIGFIIFFAAIIIAMVTPIILGTLMMTTAVAGLAILLAAMIVLSLLEDKETVVVPSPQELTLSWVRKLHNIGFWLHSDRVYYEQYV